jgi:hypothetical protein
MIEPTSPAARELLARARTTGRRVAVIYMGADTLPHYREGWVVAIDGSRLVLDYLDPAGTTRRASFDLANPHDVLAVEAAR